MHFTGSSGNFIDGGGVHAVLSDAALQLCMPTSAGDMQPALVFTDRQREEREGPLVEPLNGSSLREHLPTAIWRLQVTVRKDATFQQVKKR